MRSAPNEFPRFDQPPWWHLSAWISTLYRRVFAVPAGQQLWAMMVPRAPRAGDVTRPPSPPIRPRYSDAYRWN